MKMIPKRSEELRQSILGSPALLKALSEKVADVLGDSVALPENTTYVFVPRVYSRPTFWPEVYATASVRERIPFGGAGPLDPEIAKVMDQERITYQSKEEPGSPRCSPSTAGGSITTPKSSSGSLIPA